MRTLTRDAPKADVHVISAMKRFGSYKAEEERQVRSPAPMKKSRALEAIISCWNIFRLSEDVTDSKYYNCVSDAIKGRDIGFGAKDVEEFSLVLAGQPRMDHNFETKAGLFLSALINCCKSKEFTIHTHGLARPLDNIGFRNRKIIIVDGDAGDYLGLEMRKGKITVNGNVGEYAASSMRGGEIHISGDLRDNVDDVDTDGTGRVYHRGVLINGFEDDD